MCGLVLQRPGVKSLKPHECPWLAEGASLGKRDDKDTKQATRNNRETDLQLWSYESEIKVCGQGRSPLQPFRENLLASPSFCVGVVVV